MTPYKSEGWVWSNQTTTGCANCYYCWNGRCSYVGRCIGTEMRIVNGNWTQMPIGAPNEEKNEWATFDRMALEREHELERRLSDAEYWKSVYDLALNIAFTGEERAYYCKKAEEELKVENEE